MFRIILLLAIYSQLTFAETLSFVTGSFGPSVFAARSTASYVAMFGKAAISGALTEDNAAEVYVPVTVSDSDEQVRYNLLKTNTPIFSLSGTASTIKFEIAVTNTSTITKFLKMAIATEAGTTYSYLSEVTDVTVAASTTSAETRQIEVTFDQICSILPTECASFAVVDGVREEFKFMFTLEDTDETGTVKDGDHSNEIYLRAIFSNDFPDEVNTVSLSPLIVGDSQLTLPYSGDSFGDFREVRLFSHTLTPPTFLTATFSELVGSLLDERYEAATSGDLNIKELINDKTYSFSVLFVDQFMYVSKISAYETGTPLELQVLLTKQACYLLTAGFGGQHYIVDYFRMIRDNYLLKNYFGQKFVTFYYDTAPQFAMTIYHSEFLSRSVRLMAYFVYFIFNYFYLILVLGLIFFIWKFKLFRSLKVK